MSCTICWKCKNAINGCPWSRNFRPVKDWIAIPTKIKSSCIDGRQKLVDSFIVVSCPLFKADGNEKIEKVCEKFQISIRTYYRWCSKKIIDTNGKILNDCHVQKFLMNKKLYSERSI